MGEWGPSVNKCLRAHKMGGGLRPAVPFSAAPCGPLLYPLHLQRPELRSGWRNSWGPSSVRDGLHKIRREQREVQRPPDIGAVDALLGSERANRPTPPLLQHPPPSVRPRQRLHQRRVAARRDSGEPGAGASSGVMTSFRPPRRRTAISIRTVTLVAVVVALTPLASRRARRPGRPGPRSRAGCPFPPPRRRRARPAGARSAPARPETAPPTAARADRALP